MNSTRLRREEIKKRAQKMRKKYFVRELKEAIAKKEIRSHFYEARVYLHPNNNEEGRIVTSIVVDLPKDKPTEKILEMQKNGFWTAWEENKQAVYIPPEKILQVIIDTDKLL